MNVSLTVFSLRIDLNGIAWTWHVSPEMKARWIMAVITSKNSPVQDVKHAYVTGFES